MTVARRLFLVRRVKDPKSAKKRGKISRKLHDNTSSRIASLSNWSNLEELYFFCMREPDCVQQFLISFSSDCVLQFLISLS